MTLPKWLHLVRRTLLRLVRRRGAHAASQDEIAKDASLHLATQGVDISMMPHR
jgi:hypothetical protein